MGRPRGNAGLRCHCHLLPGGEGSGVMTEQNAKLVQFGSSPKKLLVVTGGGRGGGWRKNKK